MKELLKYYISCSIMLASHSIYAIETDSLFNKANEFFINSDYISSLELYFKTIKSAEKHQDSEKIVRSSWGIARSYYYLRDNYESLKWYYKALQIAQINRLDSLLPRANYNIGVIYIEALNIDSALKYSNKAISLGESLKYYDLVSQTYSTLAELHLNTSKNKTEIESAIANAEKFAHLANDKTMMAFAKSKRYNYSFFLKKNYPDALTHINMAEKLYLETGNREAILNTYRGKAECLIMLKDTSARFYMLRWFSFKDSIFQAEKAASIAKYETLYEIEKKEAKNIQLQQENELNNLKIQSKNRILIIVISTSLLLILTILWLLGKNNLKKKQQELIMLQNLQQDKERIARDLHDNVGGQLSYIVYSLDGINDEQNEKRLEITKDVNQAVRSVISSLRETIWAISDANIVAQDFSDKLKVFAKTLFKHSQTQIYFIEELKTSKELNALLGLNLFRICQEILNNAFKHANATEIKIQFDCNAEKFSIIIADNGIGINTSIANSDGYGLQNIKKRADEFGIKLHLQSEINKGTRYELSI